MNRRPLRAAAPAALLVVLAGAGSALCARPVPVTGQAAIVVGPTYEIKEPSMLEELLKRIEADQASGAMKKRMAEGQARALESLQNPAANNRLARASTLRTWYYDPTIVVTENISVEGKVIVPAGTRVNPLEKVNWSKVWVFIDARDPAQVSFARRAVTQLRGSTKVILTGGRLEDAGKALGQAVYFDQGARLVSRFAIGATPATVRQEGRRLRIDEVTP